MKKLTRILTIVFVAAMLLMLIALYTLPNFFNS